MDWTDESIAALRDLWAQGLSTAEIGRRMQITKNAVVGKAHRLTLPPRPSPIRKNLEPATTALQAQAGTLDRAVPVPERSLPAPAIARPVAPKPVLPVRAEAADRDMPAPPVIHPAAPAPVVPVPQAMAAPIPTVAVTAATEAAPPVADRAEPVLPSNVQRLRPLAVEPAREPPVRESAIRPASAPAPRRRGLSCCWPLGEPGTKDFHFCGGEPTPGKPYCAEHAALAYVKLRDRRDSVA